MAVDPLVGFQTALRNQVNRSMPDAALTRHNFVGALKQLDDYSQVPGGRFQVMTGEDSVAGSEIQFDFRTGVPEWSGVDSTNGDLDELTIADAENFSVRGAKMPWSAYQGAENIRKNRIYRHKRDPAALVPYVKTVGRAMVDGFYDKLETDLFPAVNMVDNDTTYMAAENRVGAVPYSLQDPAAGVYEYASLNLNAAGYTLIKALFADDFGVPSASNIRRKLLLPLKQVPGAMPDLGICDSDVYDYMISEAEDAVRISMNSKLNYGAELVRFNGLNWMALGRLDTLAAAGGQERELYTLSTRYIQFRLAGMSDQFDVLKVPGAPGKVIMQGYVECAYIDTFPRAHGRAKNVTLS